MIPSKNFPNPIRDKERLLALWCRAAVENAAIDGQSVSTTVIHSTKRREAAYRHSVVFQEAGRQEKP